MASRSNSSSSRRASSMRSGLSSRNIPSGLPGSSSAVPSSRNIVAGSSVVPGQSRYDIDSEYVNTNPTPLGRKTVSNVPISTMTATGMAALCYLICVVLILVVGCPFSRSVTFFFAYLLLSMVALASMAGINMIFPHYRFNCLSLSVSLLYSGTAALILSSLFDSAFYGLCWQDGDQPEPTPPPETIETTTNSPGLLRYNQLRAGATPGVGLFQSGVVSNYFLWFLAAVGLAFQVVAHYFYG